MLTRIVATFALTATLFTALAPVTLGQASQPFNPPAGGAPKDTRGLAGR